MLLVVGVYLAGFLLHAVSVLLLPLYLAQACVAFSMPVTAICSARWFEEPLGRTRVIGVAAVCVGIAVLALGAGEPGRQTQGWALPFSLIVLLVCCAVAGVLLLKGKDAVALGAVAGLGYAGSALAMRGVGTSLTGPTAAAALPLPLFGLLAFWLYSVSMTRADVTPATAALIVNQTFVPAVVGLVFLGDTVADGSLWLVVTGLVVGSAGATLLSPRVDPHART